MEELVLGEYRLMGSIGHGAFGQVLKAISIHTQTVVAIKFEEKGQSRQKFLSHEISVLQSLQGGRGIPRLFGSGKYHSMKCMVMELLGMDLQNRFNESDKQFSLKSVLEIGVQGVERIKYVHERFYTHRDIKPQNLLLGQGDGQEILYLADYGLAKKYQNGPMGSHIAYREDKSFAGTACYASLNTHLGIQQSRRDDLESLLFVLCYLLQRKLPWQKRYKSKEEKIQSIRMQKTVISPEVLFTGCHPVFVQALNYIRTIGFDDPPDYSHIRHLLYTIASACSIHIDGQFDWGNIEKSKRRGSAHGRNSSRKGSSKGDSLLGGDLKDAKIRRSLSPTAQKALRVTFVLPVSCENSTYEGVELPEGSGEGEESTVKLSSGPTIDRRLLPRLRVEKSPC